MAADYDVVAQRQTQTLDAQGQTTSVMVVTFQTKPEGIIGSVDIPIAQYSPDTVAALVEARVQALKAVHAL